MEVSQILNSRPLGIRRPSENPLDGGPITPNHLLLGQASAEIPEFSYDVNLALTRRIRFNKEVVQEFWEKWKVTVFSSWSRHYKWHT